MNKKFLWCEEYRPHTIEDCILPVNIKGAMKGFLEQKEIPNLLFCGSAGVGKTTVAKAICDEIGASYIVINGSDEGRFLDTVRNKVRQFATTVSLTSGAAHKVVIIDEADNTTQDVQLSLRAAVEEFHNNCRFIFTCNFPNKIIEPLHSRCTVVDFKIKKSEEDKLQAKFLFRLKHILDDNQIEYQDKVLLKLIKRYYPDWRRLINETQRHSANGKIDSAILVDIADINIDEVLGVGVVLDGNLSVLVEEEVGTGLHEGLLGDETCHSEGLVVDLNALSRGERGEGSYDSSGKLHRI